MPTHAMGVRVCVCVCGRVLYSHSFFGTSLLSGRSDESLLSLLWKLTRHAECLLAASTRVRDQKQREQCCSILCFRVTSSQASALGSTCDESQPFPFLLLPGASCSTRSNRHIICPSAAWPPFLPRLSARTRWSCSPQSGVRTVREQRRYSVPSRGT